jgi:hypothetical protein
VGPAADRGGVGEPELDRLRASPSLAAFLETAKLRFERDGAEAIWACRDDFARLLDTSFVSEVVAWDLQTVLARPTDGIRDSSRFSWSLHRAPAFELNVIPIAPAADRIDYLYGASQHRLLAALRTARVGLYHHTIPHSPDIFDRSVALSPLGERELGEGEVLELRAWRDVCDPRPSPSTSYLIELSSAPVDRVRWTYDRATLLPHTPTPAIRSSNLIEFAVWTLLELGHPDTMAALRRVAEHPSHHVRWTALRAAVEVDPAAATPLLEAAQEDPHPHVRNAARRGLDRLRSGEES